jgi:viroplasmin and RNaseH domain-containing protein
MPNSKKPGGVKGYVGNVFKEVKDFGKAYKATGNMSNSVGPGTDRKANILRKKQDQQMGQLFGAALQGRRYDDKTGKQIKAAPANARKIGPKNPMPKKAK